jgi:energy-coupling factor transporter ATP-binding protein EcfA2
MLAAKKQKHHWLQGSTSPAKKGVSSRTSQLPAMPDPSAPERPIQNKAEDKLERARFIERLASALINPETKNSTGVVVGITGPWGSGKSSLLNLLREHIQEKYPDALVVSFDPWLVSGRNDLIAEFLGEMIGTINATEKRKAKFKRLGATIAQYGAQLASLGNLWMPGLGAIVGGGFKTAEKALPNKKSLTAIRVQLIEELREVATPIIVLVDELDRIEDEEIRTIAQLVRSVLDFPVISYVLAYDSERVIQALGSGTGEKERLDRGRSYLEKIVQPQIPIPATFADEIKRLLIAEIKVIEGQLRLPVAFENVERFNELLELVTTDVIQTPRDIRRLVGTFHVLAGMRYGEVDWIDLLAYSALLIKAPRTIAKMRRDPDEFSDDIISERAMARLARDEKQSPDERLGGLIPAHELNDGTRKLIEFLFPALSDTANRTVDHPDALHKRRPLLSTLRLGLLPGAYSREEIQTLFKNEPDAIKSKLQRAYNDGVIDPLTDRIDDLYDELSSNRVLPFWRGIAAFAAKPDCVWITAYNPMHEKIYNFAEILEGAVGRNKSYRDIAVKIFSQLKSDGENELVALWLRTHVFAHNLFGNRRDQGKWFLDASQTEAMTRELAATWRSQHLSGKLIPCRWDLQPVYTMVDMNVWDEPCRNLLDELLDDNNALDGFTLMLYGGPYSTGRDIVGKMCDLSRYLERAKARLQPDTRVCTQIAY